ncbi:triose-phosphate isomerase family protein [Dactylosporangium sp. AC04546]|uniref:triose-phosphate isomerase family protein n=1 Tax=Dactylosporangium sp. AC04546 TaxID=2862460 RepID=UPI001EDF31D5|nr:triose-phosphate isomerase family protein [Dactylosporangium sp. AC04546]WVK87181.1 triose-phosphate isomerase family protein [Dactylosporangium sp. AC04546]
MLTVGVSLKLYLDLPTTLAWCDRVLDLLRDRPGVAAGRISLWVLPSLPAVPAVLKRARGTALGVGAQDLFWADRGPYTGAVSGTDLAALGCRYVTVGHAERRRYFGEDDAAVAAKTAAALRAGLTPVVCVGEAEPGSAAVAAAECVRQLDHALTGADATPGVIVAYEPHWAIGAPQPATAGHITAVCAALREHVAGRSGLGASPVIYGGSAGPGLLSRLDGAVDGLFLGRFAHDPAALAGVLDEADRLVPA